MQTTLARIYSLDIFVQIILAMAGFRGTTGFELKSRHHIFLSNQMEYTLSQKFYTYFSGC